MNLVLDLDGTLCDCRHRLHLVEPPFPRWELFQRLSEIDKPFPPVLALVRSLVASGWTLIIHSGRPEAVRDATTAWLRRYQLSYARLQLRPPGNTEPAAALKLRWLQEEYGLCPGDTVVLDDQPYTVDLLRDHGWMVLANFTDRRLSL